MRDLGTVYNSAWILDAARNAGGTATDEAARLKEKYAAPTADGTLDSLLPRPCAETLSGAFPGPVTSLCVAGERVFAACGQCVYELDCGIWRPMAVVTGEEK